MNADVVFRREEERDERKRRERSQLAKQDFVDKVWDDMDLKKVQRELHKQEASTHFDDGSAGARAARSAYVDEKVRAMERDRKEQAMRTLDLLKENERKAQEAT